MKTLEQALSLASILRIERERRQWLKTFASIPEEQRGLTQAWYDGEADKALAQSLADAACEEVRLATARMGP